MSARHVGANGVPLLRCVRRFVSCLAHSSCFIKRRVPGDISLSRYGIAIDLTTRKQPLRHLHAALSVVRAKYRAELSNMETEEFNTAEIEKEQGVSVSESQEEVKESGKKRKSDDPEEHEGRRRGKKRKGSKQIKPGDRYVPPPQKRNPGVSFNQEHFAETSYYFEGGLRKVHPYYFDFKTYCKGRWIGKTILEVFSSEFRTEPLDYYKKAVKEGRVRLNEVPVDDLNITLKVGNLM